MLSARYAAPVFFLSGIFLTTAASAVAIPLLDGYSSTGLTWLRFASMVALYPVILTLHRPSRFVPDAGQIRGFAALGVASMLGLGLFLLALSELDLAAATGLFFCYPFIAVLLARLVHGEKAGHVIWLATGLGFLGVAVLFRPESAGINLFSLCAVGSGVAVAAKMVLTRSLGLKVPPLTTAAGEAITAVLLLTPFITFDDVFSGRMPWLILTYLIFSNASRILVVIALTRSNVSGLAALGYFEIIFAAGFQVALFERPLTATEILSFTIIIAAGLGLLRKETAKPGSLPAL
jgi:drug/metabolite transporter (DMT)-like permease